MRLSTTRAAVVLGASLTLGLNLAFTASAQLASTPPSSLAASTAEKVTYKAEVEFEDGSSIVADMETGHQVVYAADSGEAGVASGPDDAGGVAFEDPDTGEEMDGPVTYDEGAEPDEPLPGDAGDATVGAGETIPPGTKPNMFPTANTPNGFKLWGTNVTAYGYLYKSEVLESKLHECKDGACHVIGLVHVSFRQRLNGGDSIRWRITPRTSYRRGPAYSAEWEYWCGVNVPKASDITCRTNDDSAGSSGLGPYYHAKYSLGDDSYPLTFSFGRLHANRAKFPMVREEISWPGYPVTVVLKFRGWDIRKYDGVWKMSPVSGTGW